MGVDRAQGFSVAASCVFVPDGLNEKCLEYRASPGFSRQQESARDIDTCHENYVPLPPSLPDTVRMGVDRAHVVATDVTVFSPLLANVTTSRAAASDATGLVPFLRKLPLVGLRRLTLRG